MSIGILEEIYMSRKGLEQIWSRSRSQEEVSRIPGGCLEV